MIFKQKTCPWHKCEIGFKYHHTGQQWDQHVQYARVDIPKIQASYSTFQDGNMNTQASIPCVSKHDNKWRAVALGTTLAVWVLIIIAVVRIWS